MKYSYYSLSCFLSSLNCLSVFSHISLSIFRTAILNALLSFISHIPMCSSLISGYFSFSFELPHYFGYSWYLMGSFSVQASIINDTFLADSYEEVFLLFPSKWHWATSVFALWNPKADLHGSHRYSHSAWGFAVCGNPLPSLFWHLSNDSLGPLQGPTHTCSECFLC